MLDFTHLMDTQATNIQIFDQASPVASNNWGTWVKPRGVSMVYIMCIGAGGGGSAGETGGPTGMAGGGSGGSGAQSMGLFPAILLPDTLYISVGQGGLGGKTANSAGAAGGNSNVAIYPFASMASSNVQGQVLWAGGGGGSGASSANAGGLAGAAGAIGTTAGAVLAGLGFTTYLAGQVGLAGPANTATAGTNAAYPTTGLLTKAGSSGAGTDGVTDSKGGALPAGAFNFQIAQGGGGVGTRGDSGLVQMKPIMWTSGGGGGSKFSAGGGAGGNGGTGCGGGGGGGGTNGGLGGDGGNGLVMIIAW